jgi:hypothetical protein
MSPDYCVTYVPGPYHIWVSHGPAPARLQPLLVPRSGFQRQLSLGVRVRPLTAQEIVLSENLTWSTV